MAWYLWAFLSMVAGSFEGIIDKVILVKEPEKIDPLVAMFYRNICFLIAVTLIGLTGLMGNLSFSFSIPFLILAIFYPVTSFAYDYFLRNNELSRFTAIIHALPIFFIFFDQLFFHFTFSVLQLIGVLLLVAGGLLFSYDIRIKKSSFSRKGWMLMLIYLIISIYLYVVFKISSDTVNSVSFYFSIWTAMMVVYVILLLITKRYKRLKETARANHFLAKTILAKSFDSFSGVFYLQAISLTSLTAVSAFMSFSPLIMLIILLATSFLIRIRTIEDFSKKTLFLKITATILLVIGSLLMF